VARLGIPTASQFHRLITPKSRKPATGDGPRTYRNELLMEWLLGVPKSAPPSGFMERGSVMETEARRYYEFQSSAKVERIGFVLADSRMVGASPDGFVGADGVVEIKCPAAHVHIGTLLGDNEGAHYAQAQGVLWLAGRGWCDLVSYNPEIPSRIVRYRRDEAYIALLAGCVAAFSSDLLAARQTLLALGCVPQAPMTEAEAVAEAEEAATVMPF